MLQNNLVTSYRSKNVVVLGASGFIGRWVSQALNQVGANTYLLVRDRGAAKNIFQTYNVQGEIVEVDVLDLGKLRRLLCAIRPVVSFNLVGYGVDRSERNEVQAYKINAEFVRALSEIVGEASDKEWVGAHLIHVGSALEYGAIQGDLIETSAPNPTTVYGKSKLEGTLKLKEFCETQGLPGLTARLFTVYGPGEHPGRLLPSLIIAAKTGKSLDLTHGLQKRDFTYVGEVAEGLLRLGLSQATPGLIVNLATGRLTSVREFVEIAGDILSIPKNHLTFGALPTRTEEMEHSPVSLDRLERLISWRPTMTIEEGISRTRTFEQGVFLTN